MKRKILVRSVICLVLGFIFVIPILLIVMNAFKPNREIMTSFISFPSSLYLGNFKEAIRAMNFGKALMNTVKVTLLTVITAVSICYCAAYAIAHLPKKLANIIYMFFIFGQLIPFHTVMIAISVQSTKLGLNNTHLGLILFNAGFFSAFGIITYVGALKSVPLELEDSAAIDGASQLRTMVQIILPLLKPSTMTISVLFFLWTWNDYLLPNIIIGKNELRTVTVQLYLFKGTTNAEWNLLMAGVTMSMVPIIIVYLLAQKYIVSGMTAGAIK